jgi:hypothetical protein
VVDEISLSRNFAKYLFRIKKLFREISFRKILRNFEKYREIFVTKLKLLQGKIHFWILLYFNTTKKITFMSKIHKHLYVSISVFSGTDPMIRIHVKISRIRNTGNTFQKWWLKLILYVLNSKNLHNETISRNISYEISQNFAKFCERKYKEISRNFAKFCEIKISFVVISYFAK